MQAGSFRKLFSCCFYSTTPSNSTPKSSSNSQKNTANSIKEPLIKENKNPLLGLSTKQKQSTKKQVNESTLNKKNICNCEFLKELNRNNELFYIENPSHYDKLLTNKKMNPERKRRLTENFKVLNCLNKYPQNKVFLLKYNSSGIFCKITYKNFKFPFVRKKNKHNTKSLLVKKVVNNPEKSNFAMGQLLMTEVVANSEEVDERLNIFSKYHQGIKIDSDCYDKILPEKVSNYLAKKVAKNGIVVDGVCGVGGNAIQVNIFINIGCF